MEVKDTQFSFLRTPVRGLLRVRHRYYRYYRRDNSHQEEQAFPVLLVVSHTGCDETMTTGFLRTVLSEFSGD